MNRTYRSALITLFASLGIATAAHATSVTIDGVTLTEIDPLNTSTFDNNTVGATSGTSQTCYTSAGCVGISFMTTGAVAQGSSALSAQPAGDSSNYLWGVNTGTEAPNGAVVNFAAPVTSFDIYWGSIDAATTSNGSTRYDNSLYVDSFANGVTGTELVNAGLAINGFGDQLSSNDNHWFQVSLANGGEINGFLATSTSNAFEFDMPGGVPETSTWAMMILGFASLGLAGYRRRRAAKAV